MVGQAVVSSAHFGCYNFCCGEEAAAMKAGMDLRL